MIGWNRHSNVVVAKFQCELTRAQEFLIRPAFVVGIGDEAWKPLCESINSIAVFTFVGKIFVACARAYDVAVNNVVGIVDLKIYLSTRPQRTGQIDSHQSAYDSVT